MTEKKTYMECLGIGHDGYSVLLRRRIRHTFYALQRTLAFGHAFQVFLKKFEKFILITEKKYVKIFVPTKKNILIYGNDKMLYTERQKTVLTM